MSEKITVETQAKKFPPVWPRFAIELLGVILIYLLTKETVDFTGLNQRGLAIAKQTIIGLMYPSMKLILDSSSVGLGHMLLETLAIAFLGTVIGIILALPLAFLRLSGKPVMLYANGIGPVRKSGNREQVRKAVEQAAVVTLRDHSSAQELRASRRMDT